MRSIIVLVVLMTIGACSSNNSGPYRANSHMYLHPDCEPILVLGYAYAPDTTNGSHVDFIRHANGKEEYVDDMKVWGTCVATTGR